MNRAIAPDGKALALRARFGRCSPVRERRVPGHGPERASQAPACTLDDRIRERLDAVFSGPSTGGAKVTMPKMTPSGATAWAWSSILGATLGHRDAHEGHDAGGDEARRREFAKKQRIA